MEEEEITITHSYFHISLTAGYIDPEKSGHSQVIDAFSQQIFVEQLLCGRHYTPSL